MLPPSLYPAHIEIWSVVVSHTQLAYMLWYEIIQSEHKIKFVSPCYFFLSVTDDFSNKMRARLLLKQTKNVEEQDDTVLKF